MKNLLLYVHLVLIAVMFGSASLAQEKPTEPALLVELNTAETTTGACRLSFLIQNEHSVGIDQVVFETVLFDANGEVSQLTLFDFGSLPSGRPRVRQFELPNISCDGLSSILINGATSCDAGQLDKTICDSSLELKSRTNIEMLG